IHPLHVEPVAWVTGRKDLLYALFYIGSLIAYVYFKSKNSNSYYILSFLLFVMALFSKPVAVTLPLVILILEYFLFNQRGRKSLLLMIPYLILSVIFFYIAVLAQKSAGAFPHGQLSFLQRINISCSNFLFYLYKMIVPTKLACIYPIQNYWYAILVVIAIVIVVFISLKYSRIFALIMMLFVITMLPVLQLVPVGQVLSDRYTYISLTCFFFLFAGVVHTLYFRAKKILRILVIIVVLCVSVLFSFLSRSQCLIWRDGMTLWTYVINTYPDISVAYNNRGTLYGNEKNYESALKDYDRALQINPKYVKAYVHRGNTYNVLGDFDRALKDYDTALEIDSTYLDAYHNRAVLYFNAKEYELALKDLLKIRELGGHVPDEVIKYVKSLSEKKN
ncbi:MAG: tetratricopeptide repeat protein, partial [candidate division WOR-3 bacterium]